MIRPAEDLALYRAEMAEWPGRRRAARLAGVPTATGSRPTTPAVATSSTGSRPSGRCRRASCRTPASCRGVDRLDQQPQRHAAAGVHGAARRGRGRRAAGPRPAVGPGVAGLPRRPGRSRRRRRGGSATSGGCARSASPAPAVRSARSSRWTSARPASRPWSRASRGTWRVDPALLGPAVRRPRGAAVAVRPAGPRPQAHGRALRVRLPAGDVQARRQAPVGLLRAADPVRRPAGREARRHRRPQGRGARGSTRSTRTSPFTKAMTAAVDREIEDLARWLDLELTLPR